MLMTKQHCSHGQSATAIGLAAGLGGGALLLAIAAAWGVNKASESRAKAAEQAVAGMTFPDGTTKWDKYVAFNAAYADFCKSFSDEDVLRIAYDFYFADEDWKGNGKIWTYMSMNV